MSAVGADRARQRREDLEVAVALVSAASPSSTMQCTGRPSGVGKCEAAAGRCPSRRPCGRPPAARRAGSARPSPRQVEDCRLALQHATRAALSRSTSRRLRPDEDGRPAARWPPPWSPAASSVTMFSSCRKSIRRARSLPTSPERSQGAAREDRADDLVQQSRRSARRRGTGRAARRRRSGSSVDEQHQADREAGLRHQGEAQIAAHAVRWRRRAASRGSAATELADAARARRRAAPAARPAARMLEAAAPCRPA